MNSEKDKARSIVEGILKEIETRVHSTAQDAEPTKPYRDKLRQVEEEVLLQCSHGIPKKYFSRIQETLGTEIVEALGLGKLGSLMLKNRERLYQVYKKLAILIELYHCSNHEVQERLLEIADLRSIQRELVESQVDHVQELEFLEEQGKRSQMGVLLVLVPFEEAMKKIIAFLEVQQLEVFLFDDDKFLAAELKTDGKTFVYNKEDEKSLIPEAVNEVTFREVQETILEMPLTVEGRQIGHYRIQRAIIEELDKEQWKRDVVWITPILSRVIESNRNRILALKVYIDDLTQLNNKRKLNEQMGKLFKQFKQGQKKLFVAMIDIDRFKKLNDTYGHAVGDEILKQTATIIKASVPNAYRYGGEEFCAVFYGYDKEATMACMDQLRERIEGASFFSGGQEYRVTISSGVAEFETHMNSVMDAIDRADQALYASKEDGRNRNTYYDDVKNKLSADHTRLRREILQLNEKLKLFSEMEKENTRLRDVLEKKKKIIP